MVNLYQGRLAEVCAVTYIDCGSAQLPARTVFCANASPALAPMRRRLSATDPTTSAKCDNCVASAMSTTARKILPRMTQCLRLPTGGPPKEYALSQAMGCVGVPRAGAVAAPIHSCIKRIFPNGRE